MKRNIVEKLEFGCPFKSGTIGEKDSELAEVIMQEAANEITLLCGLLEAEQEDCQLQRINKNAEWERAERLRNVGAKLANCAFNLAQKTGETLTGDDTAILDQLRKDWDAAASV